MCKYALKHSVFFLEAAPSFSFYCPFRAPVKCAMMKGEWKRSVKHVKQPRNPRRLVVKVGTSTLTRETGSLLTLVRTIICSYVQISCNCF